MSRRRGVAVVLLSLSSLFLSACSQTGYQLLGIFSTVPYYKIDFRSLGHKDAETFFLLGLHCIDPLTVTYSLSELTKLASPMPNDYYGLVRDRNSWKMVDLRGKLSPGDSVPKSKPPDGRLYRTWPWPGYALNKGVIENSIVSGLPDSLDMSFVDLSKTALGEAYFFQVDETTLQSSLLVVKTYRSSSTSGLSYLDIYNVKAQTRIVSVEQRGSEIFQYALVPQTPFESGEMSSGFYLYQPNIHEALLFDLREHWPKSPQPPGVPEPKCAPLN